MCNKYPMRKPPEALFDPFTQLRVPFRWAEGRTPNLEPRDEITVRDSAPVVRQAPDGVGVEAALLPWAWSAPNGRPVFNFRAEGRSFARSDRCLIPADGFYEFTERADGKKSPKHRHLFTLTGHDWFWIAGLVRDGAFAMLTVQPGPEIAPFHDRQIVVLPPLAAMDWLALERPEAEVLRPLPAGSLTHMQLT